MSKSKHLEDPSSVNSDQAPVPQRTSFRQAILLVLSAIVLFFVFLEGGLALFGVNPILSKEDPFVGFAGNVPLFVESVLPDGRKSLSTAFGKYTYFNPQQFPEAKNPNTYRIFCLGGSTTYGRPYNDLTSFAGWLRELLPEVDGSRDWQVINAGGISYASYRVARLMEELVQYQPNLFIVYTGHNEFLEERTYASLREVPEAVKSTVGVLAKTRTWAAMNSALAKVGLVPAQTQPQRVELAAEVKAILDKSSGLDEYRRDDGLRERIFEHYRLSLERMAAIARQAGAQIIFVTPASNLKDFSPFKSEHTDDLDRTGQQQSEALLTAADASIQEKAWSAALARLDEGIALDPRYAELHYRRGQVLFQMGRFDEALAAFERSRDEDVCPLRALTTMRNVVAEVARKQDLPLIDYVALVEQQVFADKGHRIPGEESFLDHVHPTIEGHRLLATALVDSMIAGGIVHSGAAWPEAASAAARSRIEARIDPHLQAKSLLNLAKVLHWARKFDDARRSARQALAAGKDYPAITAEASQILLNMAWEEKNAATAERYLREAIAADPWNLKNRHQLAIRLLKEGRRPEGVAHILLSAALQENSAPANSLLGQVLFETRHYEQAYPYLRKALQLNPSDNVTQLAHTQLRKRLGPRADQLLLPAIVVRRYPSQAPREIFLSRQDTRGSEQPDGVFTEWFEDGNLKRYAEYEKGIPKGVDLRWDEQGQVEFKSP